MYYIYFCCIIWNENIKQYLSLQKSVNIIINNTESKPKGNANTKAKGKPNDEKTKKNNTLKDSKNIFNNSKFLDKQSTKKEKLKKKGKENMDKRVDKIDEEGKVNFKKKILSKLEYFKMLIKYFSYRWLGTSGFS